MPGSGSSMYWSMNCQWIASPMDYFDRGSNDDDCNVSTTVLARIAPALLVPLSQPVPPSHTGQRAAGPCRRTRRRQLGWPRPGHALPAPRAEHSLPAAAAGARRAGGAVGGGGVPRSPRLPDRVGDRPAGAATVGRGRQRRGWAVCLDGGVAAAGQGPLSPPRLRAASVARARQGGCGVRSLLAAARASLQRLPGTRCGSRLGRVGAGGGGW